jgi:hypothetical protein
MIYSLCSGCTLTAGQILFTVYARRMRVIPLSLNSVNRQTHTGVELQKPVHIEFRCVPVIQLHVNK